MKENFYQTINKHKHDKRKKIEKIEPEPTYLYGFMMSRELERWSKEDILRRGITTLSRIGFGLVVAAADEIGWERMINLIYGKQGKSVTEAAKAMMKQHNVTGNTRRDVRRLGYYGSEGCGFYKHQLIGYSDHRIEIASEWCPMVQAAIDVGLGDKCDELGLWCDAYDRLEAQAVNPGLWYSHHHCLGRGDKYCRLALDFMDGPREGESFYQVLKRHRDETREEIKKTKPEPPALHGFHLLKEHEGWSKEHVLERAVGIMNRIAVNSIMIVVEELGLERFMNGLMAGRLGSGFTEVARKRRKEFGIGGDTLLDAAVIFSIGLAGCGFDTHRFIEFTTDRVEGIGETCPLVQVGKEIGVADKIGKLSLWCDAYANCEAHATNENISCVYTHCLGRGDKYCRFLIEHIN